MFWEVFRVFCELFFFVSLDSFGRIEFFGSYSPFLKFLRRRKTRTNNLYRGVVVRGMIPHGPLIESVLVRGRMSMLDFKSDQQH